MTSSSPTSTGATAPRHSAGGWRGRRIAGRAWGTDAALAILRYGFRELGLERIEAETAETNEAAQHVLARLGFRPEGRRRKALARDGQRWDSLIYGLLREEFSETP
ncbi:MAG: GNAT family N-acetyltransferase [Anaerolineales bacterium]|nr:GNAT family N-acetyltransferase [Anaerolineales bacterium]